MREIKFRLFSQDTKKVIYPDDRGWFHKSFVGKNGVWQDIRIDTALMNPEKVDIMQYTGLKDKNGKEIYEGDIIRKKFKDREIGEFYAAGEVVFGKWFAGFTVPYNYHGYNKLERLSSNDDRDGWVVANREMEVIGNIYENPELLEKGE